jgi:hypothetical protein
MADRADTTLADRIEYHADAILRASGSGLRNYSMDKTRKAILSAMCDAYEEAMKRGAMVAQKHFEAKP